MNIDFFLLMEIENSPVVPKREMVLAMMNINIYKRMQENDK